MAGQGSEAPARKCFHRWLKRWVEDGVLVLGGVVMEGPRKNVRIPSYLTPPIPHSRVGCEKECPLSIVGSNPSEEGDLTMDTGAEDAAVVHRSDASLTMDNDGHSRERVHRSNPVFATDLTQRWTNAPISDTDIGRTSESRNETSQELHPPRVR